MAARARYTTLIALSVWVCACAGGRPSVRMIGVAQAEAQDTSGVEVLLEVVNPSQTELVLSRLDYHLDCNTWAPLKGSLALSRSVQPSSSEVVQIPIRPRARALGESRQSESVCELSGRLYAVDQKLERWWRVRAKKRFRNKNAALSPAVRVTTSR